ncbi:hypothetical protein LXL04_023210 [Taraxacum kok-saghyz]
MNSSPSSVSYSGPLSSCSSGSWSSISSSSSDSSSVSIPGASMSSSSGSSSSSSSSSGRGSKNLGGSWYPPPAPCGGGAGSSSGSIHPCMGPAKGGSYFIRCYREPYNRASMTMYACITLSQGVVEEYKNHDPYGRQMSKTRNVTDNIVHFHLIVFGYKKLIYGFLPVDNNAPFEMNKDFMVFIATSERACSFLRFDMCFLIPRIKHTNESFRQNYHTSLRLFGTGERHRERDLHGKKNGVLAFAHHAQSGVPSPRVPPRLSRNALERPIWCCWMLPTPPTFGFGVLDEVESDVAWMLVSQHPPTPNSLKPMSRRIARINNQNPSTGGKEKRKEEKPLLSGFADPLAQLHFSLLFFPSPHVFFISSCFHKRPTWSPSNRSDTNGVFASQLVRLFVDESGFLNSKCGKIYFCNLDHGVQKHHPAPTMCPNWEFGQAMEECRAIGGQVIVIATDNRSNMSQEQLQLFLIIVKLIMLRNNSNMTRAHAQLRSIYPSFDYVVRLATAANLSGINDHFELRVFD